MPIPVDSPLIGLRLGRRYEIQEPLGGGGMALVFVAHDSILDRLVAIKAVELRPEAVETFIREARTIARLDHPHILDVYDLGTEQIGEENLVYLVMQLASGGALTNRLREGPLPPNEVKRILYQVSNALDYAHRQGVVHLDLKPANILFDEHGNVLVADFGLAQLLYNADPVKADAFVGTLAYTPPEQMLGREITPASDVYALGLALHEMLTGELPEREWTDEGLISHPAPSLPPAIRAVLEKATHHHSGQRYATAGELAEAFAEALARSSFGLHARREPSPIPPGPSVEVPTEAGVLRRWPGPMLRLGLISVLVLIAVGLSLLGWERWKARGLADRASAALPSSHSSDAPTPSPSPLPTPTPTFTPSPSPSPTPQPSPTPLLTPTPSVRYALIRVERLSVYAGPGEQCQKLGEVYRGSRLPLRGRTADGAWWQVEYLGREGWIRAQPIRADMPIEAIPIVNPPPCPTALPTVSPTPTASPTPRPLELSSSFRLQNPGFEGIRDNIIPGWNWWAFDNYSPKEDYDPATSFETPLFKQADDPARFINGPTLQVDGAGFLKFRAYVFQSVNVGPGTAVRFSAAASAYTDAKAINVAVGVDPNGGPGCQNAHWGTVRELHQNDGVVRLVAPLVTAGPTGWVTLCLYAEPLYPAVNNAAFFDDAVLIVIP